MTIDTAAHLRSPVTPACHHCGEAAEVQWPRHATLAEAKAYWDALEANIIASGNPGYVQDRTGAAHVPVYACGDHVLGPICTHTMAVPQPCPLCHALPGSPCTTADGRQRPVEHPARIAATPRPGTCTHAHQADCGGYGNCHCKAAG